MLQYYILTLKCFWSMMIIGFLATAVIVLYVHFGLAGFCALIFFITLLCMREVLCETNKKVWFLAVFLAIMLFVASEAGLFLSFFWASIHFIASPFYIIATFTSSSPKISSSSGSPSPFQDLPFHCLTVLPIPAGHQEP